MSLGDSNMAVQAVATLTVSLLMLIGGVIVIVIGTELSIKPMKDMTPKLKRKARLLQLGGILFFIGGMIVASFIAR